MNEGYEVMNTSPDTAQIAARIRSLIDERTQAVRKRDIQSAMTFYADDVRIFDVVGPLRAVGKDAVKQRLDKWLASFEEISIYEVAETDIEVSSDVACCSGLHHIVAKTKDDRNLDMWWRATDVFVRVDDRWLITHSHTSVPFSPETGLASLDLKP